MKTHVLLIEDNIGFAYFINDVLTRQHKSEFELEQATTLSEGLSLLSAHAIDVALLDLGLPDSGGLATFTRLRAHAPNVPVIILTVLDDDALAIEAMRLGAQDYLVKDQVNKALLAKAIRYAVERSHVERRYRQLSARLLQLQDEERRRIARSLHDVTAQNLAALSMNLSLLNQRLPDGSESVRPILSATMDAADTCTSELRTMSYLLHPPLLDELGLRGAVQDYVRGFRERSGLAVTVQVPESLGRLPKDVETTLFRVLQECLTNVHRHAGGDAVSVTLDVADGEAILQIADNGHGIPDAKITQTEGATAGVGVGIAGMRERLSQLGGRLEIESGVRGTSVSARVPAAEILLS